MEHADEGRERRIDLIAITLFGLVAVLAGTDLVVDLRQGTTPGHVVAEGLVVLVGLGGIGWMAARLRRLARDAQTLRMLAADLARNLDTTRAESERWRVEAGDLIHGLAAAIDRQLDRWSLSPAEKDIALLLLKGLSHKEVASVRGVSETTVRQQARSIYRKSGLTGRNDLAAFFLEDLLGPRAAESPAPDG